jgi:hypothetical protein
MYWRRISPGWDGLNIGIDRTSFGLVVVLVVDDFGVGSDKLECHAPVAIAALRMQMAMQTESTCSG